MTTQALYNKWRGQTFHDILGQEHITATLQQQIRAGRIGHAYLFTGLRGTGKTSTARIMAKAVNCVGDTSDPPCNECPICRSITEGRSVDLIEIDAASNRGIDEIRDLRDKVLFAPSEGRYKVYVIDEVHMLTNEAFNALLKTLEEPPSHVLFILCTTEPHRLPQTVLSRCQRFDFRRGSLEVITAKLQRICEREGIDIAPEALTYIARRATGSFRDAESLLDQLAAYGSTRITVDQVREVLGSPAGDLVMRVVQAMTQAELPAGLRAINEAIDQGAEPRQFLDEILDQLRALMLMMSGVEEGLHSLSAEDTAVLHTIVQDGAFSLPNLVRAIKLFSEAGSGLRNAARPQLPLELALIEAVAQPAEGGDGAGVADSRDASSRPGVQPSTTLSPTEDTTGGAQGSVPAHKPRSRPAPASSTEPRETATRPRATASKADPGRAAVTATQPADEMRPLSLDWVQGHWPQVLARIERLDPKVGGQVKLGSPVGVTGNVITLACQQDFSVRRLMEDKNRAMIERVLSETLGQPCTVQCEADLDAWEAAQPSAPEMGEAPQELFDGIEDREIKRQKLLNHPGVKEFQRLGARVAKVSLAGEDTENEMEDPHG